MRHEINYNIGSYSPKHITTISSDFEEDPSGRQEQDQIVFEVKNADLCEQIEDDDFELVLLDELPEEAIENGSSDAAGDGDISTITQPDSLNKTFT